MPIAVHYRGAWAVIALLAIVVAAGPTAAGAADEKPANPAAAAAIDKGIKFLVTQQKEHGGFVEANAADHNGELASVSLMGMVLLRDGGLSEKNSHHAALERALQLVLASQTPSGMFSLRAPATRPATLLGGFRSSGSAGSMYEQGFATLFLAESYAACRKAVDGDAACKKLADQIKPKLEKSVITIECAQAKEGGWRYQPVPLDADVSVTAIQYVALKAAKDAGIDVEQSVLDDAVQYVLKCQNSDGGFNYMANQGGSGPARSAAGLTVLRTAGAAADAIGKADHYLRQFLPDKNPGLIDGYYFYFQFYGAKAAQLAGGDPAKTWLAAAARELLKRQQVNGSWTGEATPEYATAIAVLVLQAGNGNK